MITLERRDKMPLTVNSARRKGEWSYRTELANWRVWAKAAAEGVRALLIEREADYVPLIVQRLTKRADPVAHLASKGDDLGLFELIDGEAS